MPAWLASAMRLLFGTPGRAALTGATAGSLASPAGFGALDDFIFGGDGVDGKPRRRRRRRALTASDRADIAFITGTLGTTAGRQFAMLIGARTT